MPKTDENHKKALENYLNYLYDRLEEVEVDLKKVNSKNDPEKFAMLDVLKTNCISNIRAIEDELGINNEEPENK